MQYYNLFSNGLSYYSASFCFMHMYMYCTTRSSMNPFFTYILRNFSNYVSLLIYTWHHQIFGLFTYSTTWSSVNLLFHILWNFLLLSVIMPHYSWILDHIWFLNCLCIAPHRQVWTVCFTCSGTLLFVMMLHHSFFLGLLWFLNCLCIAPHEQVWTFCFTYSGTLLLLFVYNDASLLIYTWAHLMFGVCVCATAKTWEFLSTGFRGLCMVQPLTGYSFWSFYGIYVDVLHNMYSVHRNLSNPCMD